MHGKHTDEKRRAKQFKTEQPNGCTDKENFCMAAVKQMHGWRKFLHGCSQTDIRLMADGNFWTNAIKWCETIRCEWMQFFFARIAQAVRTIGPPNLFEWLMHGIQMAIRWKPQTTRNVFIFVVFFPVIFKSCWHYYLDKNLPVFKCPDYYFFAFQTVSTLATRGVKN